MGTNRIRIIYRQDIVEWSKSSSEYLFISGLFKESSYNASSILTEFIEAIENRIDGLLSMEINQSYISKSTKMIEYKGDVITLYTKNNQHFQVYLLYCLREILQNCKAENGSLIVEYGREG